MSMFLTGNLLFIISFIFFMIQGVIICRYFKSLKWVLCCPYLSLRFFLKLFLLQSQNLFTYNNFFILMLFLYNFLRVNELIPLSFGFLLSYTLFILILVALRLVLESLLEMLRLLGNSIALLTLILVFN